MKVTVGRFRFGRTRLGDQYKDGTPANTRTWVFPVKLQQASWIACNQYFTSSEKYTGGDFVFFRDDFGDWTYRGTDAKTTNVTYPSCPL